MKPLLLATLLLISPILFAKEKPYTVDSYLPQIDINQFYQEEQIKPNKSDFIVRSSLAMSNEDGSRAVLINIENLSSGRRILEPEQLIVLFANGDVQTLTSLPRKTTVAGQSKVNITIELGYNMYPVISVLTSNNI
ncbi:hypothetical protein L1077_25470 [Pseudoalteromonas luteoviolacea]|uniref:DUF4426 domain-containing protein n=1 Tax=Pseudoalteromonas luteoviolacea H33 TaxID=1365251 RepID=A0A162AFM0_9GAMM|nr:hypothetical protein [Pseudoalteromonas luteoviolacea]KZN48893.1 hypothetical protein N476_20610 [Pseudoalteromonas luteoviolacea H33]KZN74588.1 hypothetical protein N477_21845 [Pseudoalteromonas luteoviolacea H33-S]MBQ4877847.1 hypothetical protein [Pseudoalteromonas luteoviolacea]MBQ4906882.1 hypothetical protein [Pseudoalteromonas luteoviolacea]MCF6442777.1 hypothetical protein [Pseudoalteromonas luteoviolacea]